MAKPRQAANRGFAASARLLGSTGFGLACLLASALSAQESGPAAPPAKGKLVVSPAEYSECINETAFVRGQAVLLIGDGFLPNEPVEVALSQGDNDQLIAQARADGRGVLGISIAIPTNASTEEELRLRVNAGKGATGTGVVLTSRPLQVFADARDSDGDGFKDMCDNCPQLASPELADSDYDGRGDPCDVCPNDSDDDGDKDGLCADVDPDPYDAAAPSPP
jgi:hypothetical protein